VPEFWRILKTAKIFWQFFWQMALFDAFLGEKP
jgi:hypothetical protein